MSEPVQFGTVFKNSKVASLLRQANQLEVLQTQLLSLLPDGHHGRIRIANLRDDRLVIFVADSALATYLRFDQLRILDALLPYLPHDSIRMDIRVRPDCIV